MGSWRQRSGAYSAPIIGRSEGSGENMRESDGAGLLSFRRKRMGSLYEFLSITAVVKRFLSMSQTRAGSLSLGMEKTRFQGGKCYFWTIQGRDSEFGKRRNAVFFESCIRLATLDAFCRKKILLVH